MAKAAQIQEFVSLHDRAIALRGNKPDFDLRRIVLLASEQFIKMYVPLPGRTAHRKDMLEITPQWVNLGQSNRSDNFSSAIEIPEGEYKTAGNVKIVIKRPFSVSLADLYLAALDEGKLNRVFFSKTSKLRTSDERGSHWTNKREAILGAALEVLNESVSEDGVGKKFIKKKAGISKLNSTAIAQEIDNLRHRWAAIREPQVGTSIDNIERAIRDALKNTK